MPAAAERTEPLVAVQGSQSQARQLPPGGQHGHNASFASQQSCNEALSFQLNHRDGDGEVRIDEDDAPEVKAEDPDAPVNFKFSWRRLWKFMGPGWLMSLAYLDPGNLESDLQQGSYTGFTLVWVLWWATVVGLILQALSTRIAVVTGKDAAQLARESYPRWLTWVIYVNMEIAVIASDIQEVVGSGIALYLLTNGFIPVWVGCIITGLDTFTFLAVHYFGVRYLEGLICLLIAIMTVSFFINWEQSHADPVELVKGWVIPLLPTYAITQAVGTIGAVIMPHNLYLHSGLVLSRQVDRRSPNKVNDAIHYNFIESALALLASFFINLAVVAANAGNFYSSVCAEADGGPYACLDKSAFPSDVTPGASCQLPMAGKGLGFCGEIGLSGEGPALQAGLGKWALYVWAVGLLAAGQASTMTCTYAGQIIMGGMLEIQLAPWKRVALTRAFALGPSIAVAAATINNSELYNNINEYLNVLQSVQLPFAMLPVLYLSSRKNILGRFTPGIFSQVRNYCLAGMVLVVNVILVVQFCQDFTTAGIVAVCLYACLYFFFCVRMLF